MSSETITLPERVSAEHAQDALSQCQSVEDDRQIVLDASKVESIDGGSVLVFANIARTFAARDVKMGVFNPTPAFMDAFTDLGLFEDLMKMEFRK